jgi:hypothetical protein
MTKAHTTDILSIDEQLGTAERELTALLVEKEKLPSLLHQAAYDANADEMVRLRRRADDVPVHIFSARARLLRLQVLRLESEVPELDAEHDAAQAALVVAEQAYTLARKVHTDALTLASNMSGARRAVRTDLATRQRELQALLNEHQRDNGPIVRSRPHAATV